MVYVPNHIVVGVCFPKFKVENWYPHMTLMISSGWPAVTSNAVLNAVINKNPEAKAAYEAASKGQLPAENAGVVSIYDIAIDKQGDKNDVIFVLLKQPIKFNGRTKNFY